MDTGKSKIIEIRCWVVRVPLAEPAQLATRRVTTRDWLIVRIRTYDGLEGIGFTYAGYEGGELVGLAIERLLAPLIINGDALNTHLLWGKMVHSTIIHGRGGIVQRAISAVDIALWDRNAKAANLPLSQLLSRECAATVPFYIGCGYYRDNDESCDLLSAELRGYVEAGYSSVKIKAGKLDKVREGQRARVARGILGDDADIVFDANGIFGTVATALDYIDVYAEVSPLFIEDPLGTWALNEYEELSRLSPVPLSTGETLTTEGDFEVLFRANSLKVLQIDATSVGGITAFLRLADRAMEVGIALETHWFPELHVHLAAARPVVQRAEYFPDANVINFGALVFSDLIRSGGDLHTPTTPGIGISLNQPMIEEFSIDLSTI